MGTETKPQYGYVGFHKGKRAEFYAATAYEAQQKAEAHFKPKKSERHLVHVTVAERPDGSTIVHTPVNEETMEQLDELSKSTLGSYVRKSARNLSIHSGMNVVKNRIVNSKKKIANRFKGIDAATNRLTKESTMTESEQLNEMPTRKHFQAAADAIKVNPSAKKRNELAAHHAALFAAQNPRFNHAIFYAAANATPPAMKESMMNEDTAPIGDVITLVANDQRAEATGILNDILGARVLDALQIHKQDIAQSLFAPNADVLAETPEK